MGILTMTEEYAYYLCETAVAPWVERCAPDQAPAHSRDPAEMIARCLSCPKPDCKSGECIYAPERAGKRRRANQHRAAQPQADAITRRVADMILAGWRDAPLARELGITVDALMDAKRQAVKCGLLTR
uniref:Uncharacterized protein n=1 Tax=Dulem virus 33 TaxID=3145751 RepID=A0AAU8B8M3_9CAUD